MSEILPVKISSIEEVKKLDKELNLQLEEKWKFIIGNKITYPNYYGIYQENDNYIVYYNKFDGITEKLYVGNNETKAVNIFWTKFLDEVYRSNDIIKEKIS